MTGYDSQPYRGLLRDFQAGYAEYGASLFVLVGYTWYERDLGLHGACDDEVFEHVGCLPGLASDAPPDDESATMTVRIFSCVAGPCDVPPDESLREKVVQRAREAGERFRDLAKLAGAHLPQHIRQLIPDPPVDAASWWLCAMWLAESAEMDDLSASDTKRRVFWHQPYLNAIETIERLQLTVDSSLAVAVGEIVEAAEVSAAADSGGGNGEAENDDDDKTQVAILETLASIDENTKRLAENPPAPKLDKKQAKNTRQGGSKTYTTNELNQAVTGYFTEKNDAYQHYLKRIEEGDAKVTKEARKVFGRDAVGRELRVKHLPRISESSAWIGFATPLKLVGKRGPERQPGGGKIGYEMAMERKAVVNGDLTSDEVERRETIRYVHQKMPPMTMSNGETQNVAAEVLERLERGEISDDEARQTADCCDQGRRDDTQQMQPETIPLR